MRSVSQRYDNIRATLELVLGGSGQTGLSPIVAVRRLSDGLYLQAGGGSWGAGFATNPMVETDSTNLPGFYQYEVPSVARSISVAGFIFKLVETTTATLEYVEVTVTDTAAAIADDVWDETTASHVTVGSMGAVLGSIPTAAAIADQVWDEALAGHLSVGSTGAALNALPPSTDIADLVWDEALAGHLSVGSTGEALSNAGGVSASAVADAVWDEVKSGHTLTGSFGRLLQEIAGLVQANHRLKNPTYDTEGRLLTAQLIVYPTNADALADTNALTTYTVTCTYDSNGNLSSLLSVS